MYSFWELIFPLFVFFDSYSSSDLFQGSWEQQRSSWLESAVGKFEDSCLFTKNNLILSFPLSVCPRVLCSCKHSSAIICFKSAIAVLLFVGVSTCTLNDQMNSLPDVVTGSSSLLPFRTVLCYLAQPALLALPGLFQ